MSFIGLTPVSYCSDVTMDGNKQSWNFREKRIDHSWAGHNRWQKHGNHSKKKRNSCQRFELVALDAWIINKFIFGYYNDQSYNDNFGPSYLNAEGYN